MKLDKIYTRTGDEGFTSLGNGSRLQKFHVRVAAYGAVDESNAVLGVALQHVTDPEVQTVLRHIQNDLFDVGADLCQPSQDVRKGAPKDAPKAQPLRVTEEQIRWLENQIDHFNAALRPLDSFVLPGGSPASAHLHHARTVVRRAERDIVRLASEEPIGASAMIYVNRLSDLLFVLARYLNDSGKQDVRWKPGLHR